MSRFLTIHERVIDESGGSHGVRDEGLLESAVMRPQATFAGEQLYPGEYTELCVNRFARKIGSVNDQQTRIT